MTTKHITGTYLAGYTLDPTFSKARIADTGLIAGTGFVAEASAILLNAGRIQADAPGAAGVDLMAGGRLVNKLGAAVGGGAGAVGVDNYDPNSVGGDGGDGGTGVLLAAGGSVANHGATTGGAGGMGGGGYYTGGRGGDGGLGLGISAPGA
ncbi:MAG: hypothetical protein H0X27_10475, partial [Caulobacteraceae bacterium]|nr:hypothetical protein [Caulobacteraceae bacterium]